MSLHLSKRSATTKRTMIATVSSTKSVTAKTVTNAPAIRAFPPRGTKASVRMVCRSVFLESGELDVQKRSNLSAKNATEKTTIVMDRSTTDLHGLAKMVVGVETRLVGLDSGSIVLRRAASPRSAITKTMIAMGQSTTA